MSRIWTAPARLRRSSAPPDAGGNPIGVAVDPAAGKLYWAALESGQIRAGNLDELDGADIPGATTSTYTFAEAGDYTCRVTATNEGGSTSQTSAAFTVTLLDVVKYYDVNTNGQLDPTESTLAGWRVQVGSTAYTTPKSLKVDPGVYQVTEANPTQSNWRRTTAAPIQVSATAGARTTARFGNVCVGGGGALGTGFWTNKNGQALFGADDLALMVSLNLRNANGSPFDPAGYNAFKDWLKASATNMAYDLSAQLAVMSLNVLNGKVNGSSLIAAPGATGANAAGFATVNSLMTEANTELGLHGLTPVGNAFRAYQTALRDAFVNANDNKTFVQSAPCAFSFP